MKKSISTAQNNYQVKFGVGKTSVLAMHAAIPARQQLPARRCCAGGALAAGWDPAERRRARPGTGMFGM